MPGMPGMDFDMQEFDQSEQEVSEEDDRFDELRELK